MARRLYGLAPNRTEPVNAAPVALSLKSNPTQRRAEFARMTVATRSAAQRADNERLCRANRSSCGVSRSRLLRR